MHMRLTAPTFHSFRNLSNYVCIITTSLLALICLISVACEVFKSPLQHLHSPYAPGCLDAPPLTWLILSISLANHLFLTVCIKVTLLAKQHSSAQTAHTTVAIPHVYGRSGPRSWTLKVIVHAHCFFKHHLIHAHLKSTWLQILIMCMHTRLYCYPYGLGTRPSLSSEQKGCPVDND